MLAKREEKSKEGEDEEEPGEAISAVNQRDDCKGERRNAYVNCRVRERHPPPVVGGLEAEERRDDIVHQLERMKRPICSVIITQSAGSAHLAAASTDGVLRILLRGEEVV